MQPSIGRIVHYVLNATHCAAIITHVWSPDYVNLYVFHPDGGTYAPTSVMRDDAGVVDRSWHWPERVE